MRLFYKIDSQSPHWSEATISDKFEIQPGDIVFCHTATLRDRLLGEGLMTGREIDARIPTQNSMTVEREHHALIFFSKIPKSMPYKSSTETLRLHPVDIEFGPGWMED